MIVKDEAPIITRCLLSVAPYIDHYVICDTGSSDNTVEVIKSLFDGIGKTGEIYHDKWTDFGSNRSLALQRCYGKADWALMIDADDSIEGRLPIEKLDLSQDAYNVHLYKDGCAWDRPQIFNLTTKNWRYAEPLHEYPTCDSEATIGTLDGDYKWVARCEGNRNANPTDKYKKDYFLLKSFLINNPKDTRKQFYAAQSAHDANMIEIAEKEYLKRIELGGWHEEIYISWYKVGLCRWTLNRCPESVAEAFLKAFETDPSRLEALCQLSFYYRVKNRPVAAFATAIVGKDMPKTNAILFVEEACHDWKILDEIGSTAYYANRSEIGLEVCEKLLASPKTPIDQRERILSNLNLYKQKLGRT
jgi:glycosyltransferase involved in cell wall biosynthesis